MQYGYLGLAIVAFLAGSVIPLSSEAVIVGLWVAGLDPVALIVWATVANTLGSALNYYLGYQGNVFWIEKLLHISHSKMSSAEVFVQKHGALAGFFSWVPILGSAITVVLGLVKADLFKSFTSMIIGKVLRYVIVIYGAEIIDKIIRIYS